MPGHSSHRLSPCAFGSVGSRAKGLGWLRESDDGLAGFLWPRQARGGGEISEKVCFPPPNYWLGELLSSSWGDAVDEVVVCYLLRGMRAAYRKSIAEAVPGLRNRVSDEAGPGPCSAAGRG